MLRLRPRGSSTQQPAQPVPTADLGPASGRGGRGDQRIPEPLMVSLPVIVRHELVEGAEQPTLPKQDQAVETLFSDRAHEPFCVGVGIRRLGGRQHDPHPGALEDAAESVGPLAVSIADEDLVARQESIDRIGQATRDLRHEPRIRGGGRARHVDPSASEIDQEERVVGHEPA
jgi:hypothetical protein